MTFASVKPVSIRSWDTDLDTFVRRLIGFRAVRDGEPVAPIRRTMGEAREDARAANAEQVRK